MSGSIRGTEILQELASLYARKNADYAEGGEQGEFGNFKRVAAFMKLYPGMDWATPNGVALVYSFKQLDAALMLLSLKKASVTGEPAEARLRDIAVYSVIGIALQEESCRGQSSNSSPTPPLKATQSEPLSVNVSCCEFRLFDGKFVHEANCKNAAGRPF
jgi:hypothetical protein